MTICVKFLVKMLFIAKRKGMRQLQTCNVKNNFKLLEKSV